MKTFRFFLTGIFLLCCSAIYAYNFEVDGIYYNYSGTNASVTCLAQNTAGNATAYTGDVVIPESVEYNGKNYSVTSIGSYAFWNCSGLTSVTIPNSVTSIGNYAFNSCSGLTSVTVPNSVTRIGSNAFQGCSSLTSIKLPTGLTTIENTIFTGCSSLTSIELPAGVTNIGNYAFSSCSNLTSIELPAGLTSIGNDAFNSCSSLDRIYLLGETPFTYNSSARISGIERAIIVPESALETYQQAEGWSDIAKYITSTERMTKSIEVTASNTGSAMRTAITDALVEDVVDLTIKGTINSYDIIVLNQKMPILHNLDLSEATIVACDYPYYNSYCTADNRLGAYMFYQKSSLRKVVLPSNIVGSIGSYAFQNCYYLNHINIPENITTIGNSAFNRCELVSIVLPRSLKNIEGNAFRSTPLEEILLPPNLEYIGSYTFADSKLTEIRLPSSLKTIGSNAFSNVSLKKVYTYTILPLTISDGTFGNAANAELYLPETSSENYYFATGWNKFLSHTTFNEKYEYFYLNADKELNDDTGFIEGDGENHPDADINVGGGIDVGGEENEDDGPKQPLGDVNVENDGNGNSGSMIGNGNLVVDRLHMKISVKGGKWYFFSFPFDVDLKNVWMENGSKFVFRYYDGEDRAHGKTGWKNITEGELKTGVGYIFQCSANDVLVLKRVGAQFSKKPVYQELSAHPSDNAKDASWNFMGNPYLSYYDMNEMEFTAPVTVWDGTKYVAVRPGDDDYHFTPYEAFFVQKPEGTNEVGFDGEKQMTQTQSKELMAKQAYARKMMVKSVRAKENPRKLVNLTLTAGEETDGTRIVFNEAQSRAYEADCDAAKFETQGVIQLFTVGDQKERYAINERPADNGIVVLGFTAPMAGEFTISATRMDTPVYLKDTETGALVDLSKGGYNFTAKAGTYTNRFEVLMEATVTGIQQVGAANDDDAKVYDLSGRRAKENGKGVYIINGEKTLVK